MEVVVSYTFLVSPAVFITQVWLARYLLGQPPLVTIINSLNPLEVFITISAQSLEI